eukprot:200026-Prymnesium_polylepis.1
MRRRSSSVSPMSGCVASALGWKLPPRARVPARLGASMAGSKKAQAGDGSAGYVVSSIEVVQTGLHGLLRSLACAARR